MSQNGLNGTTAAPLPTVNGGNVVSFNKLASQLEQEQRLLAKLSPQSLSSTRAPTKINEVWSLVSTSWMRAWRKFVKARSRRDGDEDIDDDKHPGPIDNSTILLPDNTNKRAVDLPINTGELKSSGRLREHLLAGLDYCSLAPEIWQPLLALYGMKPGQTPVLRPARQLGRLVRRLDIEPYPLKLRLATWDQPSDQTVREFSRTDTLADVTEAAKIILFSKEQLQKQQQQSLACRLWLYDDSNGSNSQGVFRSLPSGTDRTERLEQLVFEDQCLLLEVQDSNGRWPAEGRIAANEQGGAVPSIPPPPPTPPPPPPQTSSNQQKPIQQREPFKQQQRQQQNLLLPGVCGLVNLGNSCFMNSALQALSNVHLLTDYFLSDRWKSELNADNPLGMRGEIAARYGDLIADMWSGRYSHVAPRAFKQTLGRFAPQFSGFQQHDCQELMAFLLDGLHEDLNRVRAKPYIEVKDANGRPDSEVANEAWLGYKQRNDSAIVDLFHGQLKSTLVCPDPECAKVSVTFDPFCYLSLPLPKDCTRQLVYNLVRKDPKLPILRCKLVLPAEGRIAQFCSEIVRQLMLPISPDQLLVADVYSHRFYKLFNREDFYTSINCDRDVIYVYELDAPVDSQQHATVKVYFNRSDRPDSTFGLPIVFSAPLNGLTYNGLVEMVTEKAGKLLSGRLENGESPVWWDQSEQSVSSNTDKQEAGGSSVHPPPMFELRRTNFNLTTDEPVPPSLFAQSLNSSQPRDLYLLARFEPKAKEMCCNESATLRIQQHQSMLVNPSDSRRRTKLTDCLKLFTAQEQLGKKDAWHCPKCKKFQCATKKFDIWTLPKVLVVHLKRFNFDRYYRNKIDDLIDFPLQGLDMRQWALDTKPNVPTTYDLVSVANHYGGLGGGHYTAYGLNSVDNRWYHFDDSFAEPTDSSRVVSPAAYVLVYVRSDLMTRKSDSESDSDSESYSTAQERNLNESSASDVTDEEEALESATDEPLEAVEMQQQQLLPSESSEEEDDLMDVG